MSVGWTRDELRALVAGAAVSARDRNAQAVALSSTPLFADDAASFELRTDDPGWVVQMVHVHPDDRPRLVNMWRDALSKPAELVTQRLRVRQGDGWGIHQIQYLNLIHHPEVGAVLVVNREIGSPAEVQDGPELSPLVPELSTEPVWIVQHLDALGVVVRTDGRVLELFGRPPAELEGEHVLQFIHPADHAAALGAWIGLLREPGGARTLRQRLVQADGTNVWIDTTLLHLVGEAGEPTVLSVTREITDEVAETRRTQRLVSELVSLADGVPLPIWRAAPDGQITYANAAFRARFGGVPVVQAVAVLGDRARAESEWAALLTGSEERQMVLTANDGRLVCLACRVVADEDGEVRSVVGWCEDVPTDAPVPQWVPERSGAAVGASFASTRGLTSQPSSPLSR